MNRRILYIVVHCTATHQSATLDAILNYWEKELGWSRPGYHYIIHPHGAITPLYPENLLSNGVAGYNANSIHVCYIGGIDVKGKSIDNRTDAQKKALRDILKELKLKYPDAIIQGHRDFPGVKKDCPCFDVKTEYQNL